jgi:alpha/beta superfamily hydrolase
MLVDLVQVTTRDGYRLDGIYQPPSTPSSEVPIQGICLVHGTGGNFYSSTLFDLLAERLRSLGCGVLRINTRGHDGISTASTDRGGRRVGAAYEVADDCRHDLHAWLTWLRRQAGPRIGLLGHSFGAVKALYALAHEPGLAELAIALSPPRSSYSAYCDSPQREAFLETYRRAEEFIQQSQASALMDVQLPLPYVISAAGYREKYGPEERYNFLRFVTQFRGPVLITFGGLEVVSNMAFQGVPEALQELRGGLAQLQVETIPGGDHFYSNVRADLASRVESWLRQQR